MRRATPLTLALALSVAFSLSGCRNSTQSAASPPSASVVPTASASSTGSPTPSVAMTAGFKVSDVQEAEEVYREFYAAFMDAERVGGSSTLSPALAKLLERPARSNVEAILKSDHDEGVRLTSAENGQLKVTPAAGHSRGDSLVALQACADGTKLQYVRGDGASARGRVTLNYVYFHRNSLGNLTIFDTTSTRDVSPCSS